MTPRSGRRYHVEKCMGTVFSFDLEDILPPTALDEALAWLHRMDAVFSPYRNDSDVSRLNRGEVAIIDCAPEVPSVLDLCQDVAAETSGFFDAFATGVLDPCGVVKGWAIEQLHQRFLAAGSRRHCINGGGDIRCYAEQTDATRTAGVPQWRLGISDPRHVRQMVALVEGTDLALATSGTAERGRHILDPHTQQPPRGLLSISLTGPDLTRVDAYATAAFAMSTAARDWIEGLPGIEAYGVVADGSTWQTSRFPTCA